MNEHDHKPRCLPRPMAAAVFLVAELLACGIVKGQPNGTPHLGEVPLGLDLFIPVPDDNPMTPAKIALGRKLFTARLLSRDQSLSCSSCHDPQRAFTDDKPLAVGVFGRQGSRSAPTLINRGYGTSFFWDGRISSLEKQVVQPILDPKEMDMPLEEVVARLLTARDYPQLFQAAFGRQVNAEDLGRALASYVRTILSGNSAYDRL